MEIAPWRFVSPKTPEPSGSEGSPFSGSPVQVAPGGGVLGVVLVGLAGFPVPLLLPVLGLDAVRDGDRRRGVVRSTPPGYP